MIRRLAAAALALYRREPARANALAATLLGPLLLRIGLDVDDATTLALAAAGLNVVAGEMTRRLVTPVAPLADSNGDWQPVNPGVRKPQA